MMVLRVHLGNMIKDRIQGELWTVWDSTFQLPNPRLIKTAIWLLSIKQSY